MHITRPQFLFLVIFFCLLVYSQPVHAGAYRVKDDIIGEVGHYTVKKNDNLSKIARQFDMGLVELLAANPGVTPMTLKAGADLILPTVHILPSVRNGIVLNLPELRLFYFPDPDTVLTFPTGIGREGWLTPTGSTLIVRKRKDPTWTPPDSIREQDPDLPDVVPAGPHNPLGQYALNLGMPGYLIHGTNSPYSIGKRASHGCIRLYPEDIEKLFNAVTEGASVVITDVPYKLGWRNNILFMEVTPTQHQADAIAKYQTPMPESMIGIDEVIRREAGSGTSINWYAVNEAVAKHTGIPSAIGIRMSR